MNEKIRNDLAMEILESIKLKELSNDKLNTLIDIIIEQNELIIKLKRDEEYLSKSLKESLKMIDKVIYSYNDTFSFIKKWMEAQNDRNDSVDKEFESLRIKVESLNN